jgi:hypothetical protein
MATCAKYTVSQRVDLVLMYAQEGATLKGVAQRFHEKYPEERVPSAETIRKLMDRFIQTGSVADLPHVGRKKTATTDENAVDVLAMYNRSPIKSQVKASLEAGTSRRTIGRILKLHKFHGYKIHLVQQLDDEDFDRRLEFCGWACQQVDDDENFASTIVFSDEAHFHLNGHVNRHNFRYYSDENPHWMTDSHTQVDPRVNVWCGIRNNRLIGPFFYNENLTSLGYLDLLQTRIFPAIQEIRGDGNLPWYQQDGAPPHFGADVRNWLNNKFPGRWIGRRGPVEWPARSPDLTPLDFFLWGYLKSIVYANRPRSMADLQANIELECRKITEEQLHNVLKQFVLRLTHCMMQDGKQFEHML